MTTESAALLAHIQAENAKTLDWVAAGPNRFAMTHVEDLAHWAESGVHTVEDFEKYQLVVSIFETTREVYGYKPSWSGLMAQTLEELELENNILEVAARAQYEANIEHEAFLKAETEQYDWETATAEDRFEDLAEAAGY